MLPLPPLQYAAAASSCGQLVLLMPLLLLLPLALPMLLLPLLLLLPMLSLLPLLRLLLDASALLCPAGPAPHVAQQAAAAGRQQRYLLPLARLQAAAPAFQALVC
jgi:hypothetical protein